MLRSTARVGTVALVALTAACGAPSKASSFELLGEPSMEHYEKAKRAEKLVVLAGEPRRSFTALGLIEIACPAQARSEATAPGWWGPKAKTEIEGGCVYGDAIFKARMEALRRKADGIFGVQTTAAANGKIVLLTGTAFRYAAEEPAAKPEASSLPANPAAPRPTIEQRLQQLQELRDKGLITPEDYERRKAEILQQI